MLVDEVQSRYLEAFLLNCDAQFPPAAVGNIYLWKKVRCLCDALCVTRREGN